MLYKNDYELLLDFSTLRDDINHQTGKSCYVPDMFPSSGGQEYQEIRHSRGRHHLIGNIS